MRIILKILGESISLAWQELKNNKLRALLSTLGISIGIFCIISVFTVTDTLEINVRESVEKLGDNVIYIQKWPWSFEDDYPWWKYWQRPSPRNFELKILEEKVKGAEAMAIQIDFNGNVVQFDNNRVEDVTTNCVSHDYSRIQNVELESGRYFSFSESQAGSMVVIVGKTVAEGLFPKGIDPVGKTITHIGRNKSHYKFTVIGVFKKEGDDMMGMSNDETLMIPYNSVRRVVDEKRLEPMILAKAKPGISSDELQDEIRGAMRALRKLKPKEEDNFALNRLSLLAGPLNSMFGAINIGGWVIGGFAILVGGFGIANIMFVSVKERTSIIGIKKALGAKNYFILLEFLIESIILCLIGGTLGLLLVYVIVLSVDKGLDFKLIMTVGNVFLGLNISVIIGIIAGFWPAFIASRMDPVEAIRK